jgi:hypothetical protein
MKEDKDYTMKDVAEMAIGLLLKIQRNGQFFSSCIEFDPDDIEMDANDIQREIHQICMIYALLELKEAAK